MLRQFKLLKLNQFTYSKMSFYAVASGRKTGIFDTWEACKTQVDGFSKPVYKKFKLRQEAEEFLKSNGVSVVNKRPATTEFIEPILKKEKTACKETSFKETAYKETAYKKLACKKITKSKTSAKDYWPEEFNEEEDDFDLLVAASDIVTEESSSSRKFISTNNKCDGFKKDFIHKSVVWHPVGWETIGGHKFPVDSEGFVIVYTDGSCINNGRKNAIAGFGVYFSKDHKLNVAKPIVGRPTNNVGEIQASIYAIKLAKSLGIKKLCISTDSQFLINSITMWIKYWKMNNWVTKAGEKVKNSVDFKTLDALLSDNSIEIKWNYVRGHKGIEGNECADKLAKEGSELYRILHKTK